jgi:hypothetical protein
LETRFDLFQKLEGLDDVLLSVFAGLEIAQRGLGPVASVDEAVGARECTGCVPACLAGAEAVLDGFALCESARGSGGEPCRSDPRQRKRFRVGCDPHRISDRYATRS